MKLADGDIGWNNSENHRGRINGDLLQQTTAPTEKKRTQNIGPKSKRLFMHSEDAMELRLTWEEAQDLLRPPPSVKPTIVTIEDHEFEEYDVRFSCSMIFLAHALQIMCNDASKDS